MIRQPKVSVIMPVYNSVKYIKEAIDSILNQTFKDFELILVEDCSNDGTKAIIEGYKDERIKIIYNFENKGVAYSRNEALEHCKGEYVAIMDHDDISLPTRFEEEVDFLDKNPDYGVVGGRVQFIGANGEFIKGSGTALVNPQYIKANLLFRNVFCNSEVMFRRDLVRENNLCYDESCYGMEDFKFWIKMSKITKMSNIDSVFLKHRIHGGSITQTVSEKNTVERRRKFAELQEYSWKLSGLQIPQDIAQTIHKYVGESAVGMVVTKEQIEEFYNALRFFLKQCRKCDNYVEIEIYCRSLMTQIIGKAGDFWKDEVKNHE
ncbi:MAG: glycosyltransferase family 2 protein [Lachnospiraceae bacterium]|nr:glycosyltransferase family 2 protein [Lachnospiraceae bacterium]